MDIQFYGGNCIVLTTKNARIVIDDNLADLGGKSPAKPGDITLFTGPHGETGQDPKIVIDHPGEFEVSGVSINGIAARSHMDEADKQTATMYKLLIDDVRVLVTGHIYPELSDEQMEAVGMVDVMVVPVGGNGYTLDGIGALKVVKEVEPKVVVPTHYDTKGLQFPVPQQPLEEGLKALGMEPKETTAKFKVKPSEFGDLTQLVVLEQA